MIHRNTLGWRGCRRVIVVFPKLGMSSLRCLVKAERIRFWLLQGLCLCLYYRHLGADNWALSMCTIVWLSQLGVSTAGLLLGELYFLPSLLSDRSASPPKTCLLLVAPFWMPQGETKTTPVSQFCTKSHKDLTLLDTQLTKNDLFEVT